jgi:hypothetical protein
VLAARQLGIVKIPVMVAAGWTEAQKRAYVLADNQLAITGSGWDPELLWLRRSRADHLGEKQFRDQPRPLSRQARAVLVRSAQGWDRPLGWRSQADDRLGNR